MRRLGAWIARWVRGWELADLLYWTGIASLVAGVWQQSEAWGRIVLGLLLVGTSVLLSARGPGARR